LAKADYMKNREQVICGIKNGINGKIIVNGHPYQMPMPAFERLTTLEMTQLLTYIYNDFGNEGEVFTNEEINNTLEKCKN
ncbi:MAG: cytochrome c, partial [Lewinella sp.]|nr:cytochrome c [Lewinella sp.]